MKFYKENEDYDRKERLKFMQQNELQDQQEKGWFMTWMEKPWIRTTAIVLAVSMVFGLVGHGIYNMKQNKAYAQQQEQLAREQEDLQQKEQKFQDAYKAAGEAAQTGDYASALEHVDQCLTMVEPGSSQEAELLTTRASLNILLGNNSEALPDLQKVADLVPDSQDLLLLKSQTELGSENYDTAAEDMEKYLELNPENYEIRVTLTQLYEALEDYSSAADSYLALQELRPGDYSIRLSTARCMILAGRLEEAEAVLKPFLEDETLENRATAYFLQALGRMQAQDFAGAILAYSDAIQNGYDPAICLEQILACSFVLGDYNGVLQCAEQYLQIRPEGSREPGFYQQIGVSAMVLGQKGLALNSFNQSLALDPDYPGTYYYRGLCQFDSGLWKDAAADFGKSIEQDYLTQNCYYNRGLCYAQLLDYNKALEDMERTVNHGQDQELVKLAQDLIPSLKEATETETK